MGSIAHPPADLEHDELDVMHAVEAPAPEQRESRRTTRGGGKTIPADVFYGSASARPRKNDAGLKQTTLWPALRGLNGAASAPLLGLPEKGGKSRKRTISNAAKDGPNKKAKKTVCQPLISTDVCRSCRMTFG